MENHIGHWNLISELLKKNISFIIYEVAKATVEILGKEFLKTPTTADEGEEISTKLMERWNFPKGIVLDCTTGTIKGYIA